MLLRGRDYTRHTKVTLRKTPRAIGRGGVSSFSRTLPEDGNRGYQAICMPIYLTRQASRPSKIRSFGNSIPMNTILLFFFSIGIHLLARSLPII